MHVDLGKMLQAVQLKNPSDSHYRYVRLTDETDVTGKHYAVAVDIYDKRTSDICMSFLNVLNRKDQVTLITFGNHTRISHKDSGTGVMYRAKHLLSRKETGLNTLVGVRMLENVDADVYIMITAGYHDRSSYNYDTGYYGDDPKSAFKKGKSRKILKKNLPELKRLQKIIEDHPHEKDVIRKKALEDLSKLRREHDPENIHFMIFSPGSADALNYLPRGGDFYFPKHGPHERTIREALNIKRPQYYNISLQGFSGYNDDVEVTELPYGGTREIKLPYGEKVQITVHYMNEDGDQDFIKCEMGEDKLIANYHGLKGYPCVLDDLDWKDT